LWRINATKKKVDLDQLDGPRSYCKIELPFNLSYSKEKKKTIFGKKLMGGD
jgi:hypothetical protein